MPAPTKPRVVILGSGPNRIGQGIEFDYCCVHAAQSFRALGYEAVMVNCNPETVSTDYDTSDRLYFEPLDIESVLAVCEREQPEGVVIQFGGQTPLKLARARSRRPASRCSGRRTRRSISPRTVSASAGCWTSSACAARSGGSPDEPGAAVEIAERIGYPVLVRPSYVLGGRAMRVCYDEDQVRTAMAGVTGAVLVDRFLEGALEIDVDALCDGVSVYIGAVMEHVEEAGVHSGDSSCVLPAPSLGEEAYAEVCRVVRRLGPALGVVGLLNVQLALVDGESLRARGESARVAHRALREQGDRRQPRGRGRQARGRRSPARAGAARGAPAGARERQSRRAARSRASPAPIRRSGRRCAPRAR